MAGDVNWSAERIAEIILPDNLRAIRKEVASVQSVVAEIFVNIAVELLRSGFVTTLTTLDPKPP
ncbi:MAG: hypothetical protein M3Z85_05005 [Acidobacteriota bacterium]|nr:hypothetical protein [Acidobacteriota bacterium]